MFNSYDKEKFIVSREYYTYFMDITSRGNGVKNYTGIMKVKVISNSSTEYSAKGHTKFEILESKKLGGIISRNIHHYMNGCGTAFTDFYEDKHEAIKAHDEEIKNIAKGQSTNDREKILKKLINKTSKPKVTKKEKEAITWYNDLSEKEKTHIKWIKDYWDGI